MIAPPKPSKTARNERRETGSVEVDDSLVVPVERASFICGDTVSEKNRVNQAGSRESEKMRKDFYEFA
jgi:hypothetical protein